MDAGPIVRHPSCRVLPLRRRRRRRWLRCGLWRRRRRYGRRRSRRRRDGRLRCWRRLRNLGGPRQLLAIEIGRDRTLAAVCCRSSGGSGVACFGRFARVSGGAGAGLSRGLFARVGLRRRLRLSSGLAGVSRRCCFVCIHLRRGLGIGLRRSLRICLRSLVCIGLLCGGNAQAAKCNRGGQGYRRDRYFQFLGHDSLH